MGEKIYMTFGASETLAADVRRFVSLAAKGDSKQVDHALVNDIAERFIDEMLHAFFMGPMDALQAEGTMVNLINGVANIVNKAAKGLAKRLLSKIDAQEQAGLARHFDNISLDKPTGMRIGFALDDALANRMNVTFDAALNGEVDKDTLLGVMHAITDGSIAAFLDDSVAQLKTGMLTRGLIATARGTIRTASHSATGHMMSLPPAQRRLVIEYFQSMVTSAN